MVKRIFSCVFICILIILLLTACTEANGDSGNQNNGGTSVGYEEENGIKYYLKEDDTYLAVVESESAITSFYIPEARRGKAITEVSLEKNVTALPDNALENGNNIKKITIGTDVTSISKGALKSCTSLEHVTVPFLDTHFGYMFGVSTYNYNNKYIPSSLKSVTVIGGDLIPAYAFSGCESISSISIPDSITDIGEGAFEGCTALMYNEYDNAYYLGNRDNPYTALMKVKNSSVATCRVHSDTHIVYSYAFDSCHNLSSVTIGKSVTNIGNAAFNNCKKIVEIINRSELDIDLSLIGLAQQSFIKIHDGESEIINKNDYLFYTRNGSDYLLGYVGDSTELILPENYNGESYHIYSYAFSHYSTITNVTIPDTVTGIGPGTFSECSSLMSITIPDTVKSIGYGAFSGCSNLTDIAIPDAVTEINYDTFSGCSSLTNITIPDTVTVIGSGAFAGCSSLTDITIPDNILSISYETFLGCTSLTSITIPDNVNNINGRAFSGCTSLTSVTIPASLTSVAMGAFSGCSNLTEVYYVGGANKWSRIDIGSDNTDLTDATIYYYLATDPTESGNYWYYDDSGKIAVW